MWSRALLPTSVFSPNRSAVLAPEHKMKKAPSRQLFTAPIAQTSKPVELTRDEISFLVKKLWRLDASAPLLACVSSEWAGATKESEVELAFEEVAPPRQYMKKSRKPSIDPYTCPDPRASWGNSLETYVDLELPATAPLRIEKDDMMTLFNEKCCLSRSNPLTVAL